MMLLLSACLFTMGCGGLPKADKKRAQAIPQKIQEADKFVGERLKAFNDYQGSPEYKEWQAYAEQEKWADNFTRAKESVSRADGIYKNNIEPSLKRNDGKELAVLQKTLDRADSALKEAREQSIQAFTRLDQLKNAKAQAGALIAQAQTEIATTNEWFSNLSGRTSQATTNFTDSDSTKKIEKRFAPIRKIAGEANAAFQIAKNEFDKGNNADWALLADSVGIISQNLAAIKDQGSKYSSSLDELYKSYSKILIDAKYEHYLTIGRVSWDEGSDWPTEHNYNFPPVLIDDNAAKYFAGLTESTIGTTSSFLGRRFHNQIGGMWDILKLDPLASWPSSWDDEAEYFIADIDTKYYHKYSLSSNDTTTETDWTEVSEEFYEANLNNLNMALESKPYGEFEDEKQAVATPPGMAYVGNARYGQWRRDPSSGRSFWEFYGQYALMRDLLGGNRYYYYDDWSTWRNNYRGRTAYYGDSDGDFRYGSRSSAVQSHPRFSRSRFATGGGFNDLDDDTPSRGYSRTGSGDASVRGAGPARRGGGAGGSGK